jgi:hypothetical protein
MKYPKLGTFTDYVAYAFHAKRYEKIDRQHGGESVRGHRFEIKNGISALDVMQENITANNSLLEKLKLRGQIK